jgi:hypothetical protein
MRSTLDQHTVFFCSKQLFHLDLDKAVLMEDEHERARRSGGKRCQRKSRCLMVAATGVRDVFRRFGNLFVPILREHTAP